MSDPHDELDELLSPKPGGEQPGLRDELFRRTGQQLARARLAHRLARAAAAVAVFAAGGLAGWAAKPGRGSVERVPSPPEVVAVPVVVPVPVVGSGGLTSPGSPGLASPGSPAASPAELELKAELADDPAEAARLYRLAGDAYLNDRQDYRNAARCYRLFLAWAGDAGLSPEPGDTWLLTPLKNAAFKEKYHVANNGG
jgi:hypothetical protein